MNMISLEDIYSRLLSEISTLYTQTRHAVLSLYWNIGKHISEIEQKSLPRSEYGEYLIQRLSKDLTEKFGKGFSERNLRQMRGFYRAYSIRQAPAELGWSSVVLLLSVKDEGERKLLEERAVNEKLSYRELRKLVRSGNRAAGPAGKNKALPETVRGQLHTYSLVKSSQMDASGNALPVDCGFNIWRSVPVKDREPYAGVGYISSEKKKKSFRIKPQDSLDPDLLYTYTAKPERVIDGDTLWVIVDLGFRTFTRQKLRLRNIDAPELGSEKGERARRFVERRLKGLPFVIVKTYKSDKYDRYLTDLFFLPGVDDPERTAAEGILLNRELVEKGMAVVV
jgi:endonuclease YncB( thermonuclease family)